MKRRVSVWGLISLYYIYLIRWQLGKREKGNIRWEGQQKTYEKDLKGLFNTNCVPFSQQPATSPALLQKAEPRLNKAAVGAVHHREFNAEDTDLSILAINASDWMFVFFFFPPNLEWIIARKAQVVQAAHANPPRCLDKLTLFCCPIYLGQSQYKQWFFTVLAGAN